MFRHVVEMLTELDGDELAELGEIKAIDPTDGTLLASTAGPIPPDRERWLEPKIPID